MMTSEQNKSLLDNPYLIIILSAVFVGIKGIGYFVILYALKSILL